VTGDLVLRIGAARAYVATTLALAAALALLALAPSSLAAALASAILFGAAYNAAVGIQAIWSTHMFSLRPSLGISAAMSANGLGLMLGPLGAGLLAGRLGLRASHRSGRCCRRGPVGAARGHSAALERDRDGQACDGSHRLRALND
jgi:predicted MFS family arabinose efflux permease